VDLLKVRLQVQGSGTGAQLNLWKTTVAVYNEGGFMALYQGHVLVGKRATGKASAFILARVTLFASSPPLSLRSLCSLSASLLRQATYTTTRFGCYMYLRELLADSQGQLPLYKKASLSSSLLPRSLLTCTAPPSCHHPSESTNGSD